MHANIVNRLRQEKGKLLVAAAIVVPAVASAQSLVALSPAPSALAGSVVARHESTWYSLVNPATLAARKRSELLVSMAPASHGLDHFADAAAIAVLPLDSAIRLGGAMHTVQIPGYRELRGRLLAAVEVAPGVTAGAAAGIDWLVIDRYGTTSNVTLDIGAVAGVGTPIRFGGSAGSLLRSGNSPVQPPLRVQLGLAFDPDSSVTISFDLMHELRQTASAALGISAEPVAGLELRMGVSNDPPTVAFGAAYSLERLAFDVAGAWVSPVGLRQSVGVGIRW